MRRLLRRLLNRLALARGTSKASAEFSYWQKRYRQEGDLTKRAGDLEAIYTEQFGLTKDFYAGKRVLDIGCGPRGSLEWASGALERVGLDPLVKQYRQLGIDKHRMSYVAAGAEEIPFPDEYFDIVTVFNALDHVDDVAAAIREMTRVAKDGATCLIIVEVNHEPTPTEPQQLGWDLLSQFTGWTVRAERRAAIDRKHDVYGSWRRAALWRSGEGLLGAHLERGRERQVRGG
jgi:SAM-dependent methyltransferase